jgi:uncharacterized protein
LKTLLPEINKITEIIIREYNPDKIILFGSRARGDNLPESDIDILVVSDREKDLPRYKRGQNLRLKLAGISVPLDILFYTHADFNRFKNIRQSFCATIEREGLVLYG